MNYQKQLFSGASPPAAFCSQPLLRSCHSCQGRNTQLSPFPWNGVLSGPAEEQNGHLQIWAWGCPDTQICCFTRFLSGDAAVSLLAGAHSTHPQRPREKTFPRRRQAHTFGVRDHTRKNCIKMEPFFCRRRGTRSNNQMSLK